jgi:hypothetical protein
VPVGRAAFVGSIALHRIKSPGGLEVSWTDGTATFTEHIRGN